MKMYFLLKLGIFHCYVSLPEGSRIVDISWTVDVSEIQWVWPVKVAITYFLCIPRVFRDF